MKKKVVLFGGSGTMGYETFKVLWSRRSDCSITLLLRPSAKNIEKFKPYQRKDGNLRIVWGDATVYEDVKAAVKDADYVLDTMALISPQADYHPDLARAVNVDGIANIIRAIGEEPDGNERIRLAYTGTVAETGDRLPPIHWGRTGDPLKPSIFDYYAVTKIAGERLVLESDIKHWVSLRMTFIMPSRFRELSALADPIMFHMPLNSCMENITSRDAGLGMANVLNVPFDSSFWRKVYNMSGGPGMRITAQEYLNRTMALFGGTGLRAVSDRRWYATQNFHMQFYTDSWKLNEYLGHWRETLDDWERYMVRHLPAGIKLARLLSSVSRDVRERINLRIREVYEALAAAHRNGTLFWGRNGNIKRLDAFFGGSDRWAGLNDWSGETAAENPALMPPRILDHGYDENKLRLDADDLRRAAEFRGGSFISGGWHGDLFEPAGWRCAFGHEFTAKPNTVLKGGHWCPECEAPEWDFKRIAAVNPFFNQVIAPLDSVLPGYAVTEGDLNDILEADSTDLRLPPAS